MGKQMEGDDRQRRERAAEAREEGRRPSEEGVTTGASGQLRSLGNEASHAEKMAAPGWGKQQPDRDAPEPRPGSSARPADPQAGNEPDRLPSKGATGRAEPGELDEEDRRVFETLVRLETERDEAPTLSTIAGDAGMTTEEAAPVLQRLVDDHDVVQALTPDPEDGPRFRVKARV